MLADFRRYRRLPALILLLGWIAAPHLCCTEGGALDAVEHGCSTPSATRAGGPDPAADDPAGSAAIGPRPVAAHAADLPCTDLDSLAPRSACSDHAAEDRHVACACPCHTPGLIRPLPTVTQVWTTVGPAIDTPHSGELHASFSIDRPPRLA